MLEFSKQHLLSDDEVSVQHSCLTKRRVLVTSCSTANAQAVAAPHWLPLAV